ncbi:MAG: Segregation and condensation protein [Firmicutes bacterium]|nr:Segregation and condensation protein [Bacillota bacterium]
MEWSQLHGAIESLLFAAGNPVSLERLCHLVGEEPEAVETALDDLRDEYQFGQRGLRLVKLGDSYQMTSAPEYAPLIRDMMEKRKPDRLSQAALEVMSILAYYQPVTRAYIEQVRGVDSAYTLGLLLDRDLVEECGRLEVPGRPILYRTTQTFLRSFGLNSLEDLPELPIAEPLESPGGKVALVQETKGE